MEELTEREKYLVDCAVERALLALPEVVGSLMESRAAQLKLNKEFYEQHPTFVEHRDIVAAVIEKVDGNNPTLDYKDKLAKAVPEIERLIVIKKSQNLTTVTAPNRNFSNGVL